jgi:hypothetical protein
MKKHRSKKIQIGLSLNPVKENEMTKRTQPLAPKQPESSASRTEPQHAADVQRHARKCAICSHPDRESIEYEFIYWEDPVNLVDEYNLPSRSCVYRHAEATGLFALRLRNLRHVAGRILEQGDAADIALDSVLRAMRVYSHITEDGHWNEPPRVTVVEHRYVLSHSAGTPQPALASPLVPANVETPVPPAQASDQAAVRALLPGKGSVQAESPDEPSLGSQQEFLIGTENRVKNL